MVERQASAAPDAESRSRRWRSAVFAVAFFSLAYNAGPLLFKIDRFRQFYGSHPWQLGETVWKASWILLSLTGVLLAHRLSLRRSLGELGLASGFVPAASAAALATIPMLALGLSFPLNPKLSFLGIWMTAIVSPLAEETLFRGYLFRQLYQRSGLPFFVAALASMVPFAWGHFGQASRAGQGLSGEALVLAITGSGAILFAWCLLRWGFNLWFVVALHAGMNLWWYVFAVDETAVGGWAGNVARVLTVMLAITLTLLRSRLVAARPRLGDRSPGS